MSSKTVSSVEGVTKKRHGFSGTSVIFIISLTLVAGFFAGVYRNTFYAIVAPTFGVKISAKSIDLSSVQQTYRYLSANFDGKLDTQKLIDGANKGLVEAAGDKYTVYQTASDAKEFNDSLSGTIGGGIGAEIGLRDNKPTIVRTINDEPAAQAGLKSGDVIDKINNQAVTKLSLDQVVAKIRGDIGTTVKLTIMRGSDQKDFSVTRAEVTDPSVHSEVKDNVGIITISRFDSNTASLARQAAQSLKDQNVKGVVVDLRGNGGGLLDAAQDVAGIWLNNKVVVSERQDGRTTKTLRSSGDPVLSGVKTVALIDGNSASASEILAGALKDNGVVTLVGTKSFGKGSVQALINLPEGAQLKVTVARWYTPNGQNITDRGIIPDKTVAISSDQINQGQDPQLDAAKALIQQ